MIRPIFLSFIFMVCLANISLAQTNPRYLVLFKDKNNSPYSVENPTAFLSERSVSRRERQRIRLTNTDLPVNPAYVEAVKQTGAKVIYTSRWFNGALVEASNVQLDQIKSLPSYKGIELNLPVANITTASPGIHRVGAVNDKLGTAELDYGRMANQLALMETSVLHNKGFYGQNMLIAVLDNGFSNGNLVNFLKPVFDENRLVDSHDFVARDGNVYNDGASEHGLKVLSTMAAYLPSSMIGVAYKASFALYRTENDEGESPYEEITWLMAAERADSLGADILNSSLGYRTFSGEFNTPAYNYTRAQMDGKTTIIARAARFATRTGMLVINAAGNEGSAGLASPADVDSVLTVGGTTYDFSPYSNTSVGPNALNQRKPDVAAVGAGTVVGTSLGSATSGNGTSFAAPLIAGLSAILWQAHPQLTAQQIIGILQKSGHQYTTPDNILGYGVPRLSRAEQIINEELVPLGTEGSILNAILLHPNPTEGDLTLTIPVALRDKKATLEIYNQSGNTLFKKTLLLTEKTPVAPTQLTSGLYILKIRVGEQERSIRFIRK
ncbi:peptidase S8/S53 subtilisin kexin sedolisin [Dyadobacter luteus]|uniref:Peptidase S8/S53 subtilisin kexin sedolisin n=1 Tax=Dyadobacter luteus TaxID=2259619 RepID=A0A3D8YBX5_9BACT|nr:S8 family peptidase [Dyadobacter luteus]REA61661.1 peptidase S8/S53 subtilisin kexin sedolisin [Dyadobacter luteus]